MPDEELRRIAASGSLHDPDVLKEQTWRMAEKETRSKTRSSRRRNGSVARLSMNLKEKNENLFPQRSTTSSQSHLRRIDPFFQDLFQNDRSYSQILDADYHLSQRFISQALWHSRRCRSAMAARRWREEIRGAAAFSVWRACRANRPGLRDQSRAARQLGRRDAARRETPAPARQRAALARRGKKATTA